MNANSVDTGPGDVPPDRDFPVGPAEDVSAPHDHMLEMEMDLGWSDYADPGHGLHPSGAELRRRLITPESLAEEPQPPQSLLQRITAKIRDSLVRR
ncbi:hypothetical protein ACFSTD_10270 [Novosphingobium colocasiae]|uniref:Uncharacterized protein n=1 Tax=Novosphingobium colocasiae TaxID=1256513 RepID=A0A918UE65_9SPHN|nr:hypothetical protein [Novosphingobium colocasiae]GGY95554.1 hypothetical protein GCM10011614_07830 [Novosphingobium colocasiae]